MTDLNVDVRDHDITVTKRGTPFEVTYRKEAGSPMLVAPDLLRRDIAPPEIAFLVSAWKAAYAEAKARGWL